MKSLSRVVLFSISISLFWTSPVPGSDLTHRSKNEPVALETAPTTQQSGKTPIAPKTAPGFCCIKGSIVSSDERSCRARKGKYANNKKDILKICKPTRGEIVAPKTAPVNGYCCSDGVVLSTNSRVCEKRKGSFFTSRREADRKCGETSGYCCASGEYKESTKRDCEKVRGVFTRDRQKGIAPCQATIGFCCIRGKVMQLSRGQCDQKKGSFSSSREKAEKACLSTPGFCCSNGKVLSANRRECDRKSGTFYSDRAAALRSCQPQLSDPKGKPGTRPSTSLTRQGSQVAGVSAQAVLSLKPDLAVLNTSLGKDCKLRVTVKNQGGPIGEAEHSQAEVYISAGQGNVLSPRRRYLRVLDPNKKLKTAGAEVTYVSDLVVSGTQSTLVWLDTAHHITESNEQNNGDDQKVTCGLVSSVPGQLAQPQPGVAVAIPGQLTQPQSVTEGDPQVIGVPGDSLAVAESIPGNLMEKLGTGVPDPSQLGLINLGGLIEILEPGNGDVFLNENHQYDIIWHVTEQLTTNCIQIKLHGLGQGGGQTHVLEQQWSTRTTPGQDGYQWTVPSGFAGSYKVSVVTCDNSAGGFGDTFLVVSPNIDFTVQIDDITPAPADTGNVIRARGSIANIGLTTSLDTRATWTIRDPDGGEHVFSETLPGLSFGQHHNVDLEYKVNRAGSYVTELRGAMVMEVTFLPETHLQNNEDSMIKTVKGRPDLVVCFDQNQYTSVANTFQTWGTVYNRGDASSTETSLNFRIEYKGTSKINVPALAPSHQNEVYRLPNWSLGRGWVDFHMDVDPENLVREIDEDDNRQTGKLYVEGLFDNFDWVNMNTNYRCSDVGKGNGTIFNHSYRVTEMNTAIGVPISGGSP